MNPVTVEQRQPKTVSLWQFVSILTAVTLVFIASGYFIGKQFFWINAEVIQAKKELAYYQELVNSNPENLENRIALGYRYYLIGDYDSAVSHFKAVLDFDENYYDAHLNLGYVYFKMDKYDEALEAFEKTTKIIPNNYKGWLNFGIANYKLEQYDKAIEALERAKGLNRAATEVIYHLGVATELSGDTEGAIGQYEETLKFDPNYTEAREALKRLTRG